MENSISSELRLPCEILKFKIIMIHVFNNNVFSSFLPQMLINCNKNFSKCALGNALLKRVTKYLCTIYIFLVNRNVIVYVIAYLSEETVVSRQINRPILNVHAVCILYMIAIKWVITPVMFCGIHTSNFVKICSFV